MSRQSRSMADVLKSIPLRRSRPQHESRDSAVDESDQLTSPGSKRSTIPETRESQDMDEILDHKTDGPRKPRNDHRNDHRNSTQETPSNDVEDLVSRLSRLHKTDPSDYKQNSEKNDDNRDSEEETHRATSRQRVNKRYDHDEEPPRRKTHERHRSSFNDDSQSEDEYSDDYRYKGGRHTSKSSTRRDRDDFDDEIKHDRSPFDTFRRTDRSTDNLSRGDRQNDRMSHKSREEDEYSDDDRYIKRRPTKRPFHEDDPPRRSRPKRETGSEEAFSTLPKTAITKIAKSVGVASLSADVYEAVKDLSGSFVHNILSDVARTSEVITTAELEPVIEKYLGRPVEDLEQSDINLSTFVRWVKSLMDTYRVSLKKEAVLFFHNALEFYIICLFYNAKDITRRGRRARVTSKDIELASRMR